ncbi:MAG: translation elongation factor Ts [Candidatus Berkiellales bacterium]
MAEITAAMVKDLRERTGAGMMECKKALVEANGDLQAAEDIIAKSGSKKAAKSASRTAAEGRITIASSGRQAAILEVNCETDFVARDENFIQFCEKITQQAVAKNVADAEQLLALPTEGNQTVEEVRKSLIARIGENIQIRRVNCLQANDNQRFGTYIHHARIGVIVLLQGGNDQLAKDLAMHIAAMKPQYLSPADVPSAIVDKEKEILFERAAQSGKPKEIVEKMIAGQLQKQLAEICLMGQPFFKDPDQTIGSLLKSNQSEIKQMVRFEVGEGIEVVKKSFEEEVNAARGDTP